jgi:hypothetical protein
MLKSGGGIIPTSTKINICILALNTTIRSMPKCRTLFDGVMDPFHQQKNPRPISRSLSRPQGTPHLHRPCASASSLASQYSKKSLTVAVRDVVPSYNFPKEPDVPSIPQQHFASRFCLRRLGLKQAQHSVVLRPGKRIDLPIVARLRGQHQFDRRSGSDQNTPWLDLGQRQNVTLILPEIPP